MNLSYVLFVLFILMSINNLVHFGLYLVGANIYDIREMRENAQRTSKRRRFVPLVSVLIPAHNEAAGIVRCLESVRKNTYRKTQIIVINDASTDNTAHLVRDYIAKHPNRTISLLSKRKNLGKAGALNYALRRYVRGELVMTLDADSTIAKDAIANAVTRMEDPRVVGVAANVRIMEQASALGMLQKFEHLIGYRSKKFYSISNAEFIVGGVASTYRRSVMSKAGYYSTDTVTEDIGLSLKIVAQGNRDNRIVYGANVVAYTEGVQTLSQLMSQRYRWKLGSLQNIIKHRSLAFSSKNKAVSGMIRYYRLPMAFIGEALLIIEPVVLAFILFASVKQASPALFLGAYMAITALVLATIWPDEHYSNIRKAKQSVQAPLVYFLFYIMNLVQIVSIIRCLWRPSKLIAGEVHGNVWKSPTRLGEHAGLS